MRLPKITTLTGFLFSLLFVLVVVIIPFQKVSAQTSDSSFNSNVTQNDHTKAQAILIDLSSAIICQLIGVDLVDPQHGCLTIDSSTNKLGYANSDNSSHRLGGLMGMTISSLSSLYQPPVTTGEYINYLASNFGVGEHVYAKTSQTGFDGLASLQAIWISMRNLSYLIFTILFVLIGIAIMLRVKIDPRTVMSIQNQIPKIIVAIIFITFSYAIVGVLIDAMWAITYVSINILAPDTVNKGSLADNFFIIDPASANDISDPTSTAPNSSDASIVQLLKVNGYTAGEIEDIKKASQELMTEANTVFADTANQKVIANFPKTITDDLANGKSGGQALLDYSTTTIKALQDHHQVSDAQIAKRIDNTVGLVDSTSEPIKAMVNSFSDDKSLRYYITVHLNDTPLSFADGIFRWGGEIQGNAGILGHLQGKNGLGGVAENVGLTLGAVASDTITNLLGLNHSDCSWKPWTYFDCLSGPIKGVLKYFIGIIGLLIILVAMFIALIRVWFTLIKALVYVILFTILGPIIITLGLLPGSTMGVGRWLRTIIAHLAIFPAIVAMFIIARILAESGTLNSNASGQFTFLPPLVANTNTFDNLGLLIAFGIIVIMPEMLGWVQSALKAKPGPVGAAVSKGFAAGIPYATAGPKSIWKNLNAYDPHKGQMGALAGLRMHYTRQIGKKFFGAINGSDRFLKYKAEENRRQREFEARGQETGSAGAPGVAMSRVTGGTGAGTSSNNSSGDHGQGTPH